MFAPSHTIPGQSCIFAHVAFIQLQIHSFYVVYALSASYIHWPVVSDHFASCLDHFPAYFALFLPCMMVKQTFPIFFFMVPKKRLFSCNKKVAPYVSRRLATVTIYTRRVVWFLTQKRLMVKVFQHHCVYLVRNPDTERRKAGKRPAPKRRSTREQERGEVREQQRLGLSQGTTIREPKY